MFLAHGMQRVPGVTGSIVIGTVPSHRARGHRGGGGAVLRERATWRRGAAVALAVAGVVLMRVSGMAAHFDLVGVALVLGAVASEPAYTLVGKRLMMRFDPLATSAMAVVPSLPLFLAAAMVEAGAVDWSGLDAAAWGAVLAGGLGTLALGSLAWYAGVKEVEGHVAAPFMGVMPVSALVLSYLLLGEPPQRWHLPGMGLVVGAIALVARDQRAGA